MRLGGAEVRFTSVADGDFSDSARPNERAGAQRNVVDRVWKTVHQVHGSTVVTVDPSTDLDGVDADALVTTDPRVAVAVRTADCAPIALAADGVVGVAHGGWRGLMAGVVGETVTAMRRAGAGGIVAALGPCIHPECYEFSESDLVRIEERFGAQVRGVTSRGTAALDVPAVVRAALSAEGVELIHDEGICTACSSTHWSHRSRGDSERQATVAWLP